MLLFHSFHASLVSDKKMPFQNSVPEIFLFIAQCKEHYIQTLFTLITVFLQYITNYNNLLTINLLCIQHKTTKHLQKN